MPILLKVENGHKEAGHAPTASLENMLTIIRRAGFVPARRDSHYQIQKVYGDDISESDDPAMRPDPASGKEEQCC